MPIILVSEGPEQKKSALFSFKFKFLFSSFSVQCSVLSSVGRSSAKIISIFCSLLWIQLSVCSINFSVFSAWYQVPSILVSKGPEQKELVFSAFFRNMTRRISNHFFISVNGPLWFQIWKWSLECWPKQSVLCMKTVYRFLKENGPQIFQIWKCHPREEKVWITASYLCPLRNSLSLIIFIPAVVRWWDFQIFFVLITIQMEDECI